MMKQPSLGRGTAALATALGFLALIGLIANVEAVASPASDTRYGNPAMTLSPEVDAMAGTGVALYRGGFSNVLNPACLTRAEAGWRADAALSLGQEHEDRFTPLFDSFTSYLTDTAIASNRHHYFGAAGAVAMRLPVGGVPMAAAVSLCDRYGFAYDFSEDVLNPNPAAPPANPRDAIIQQRAVEIDGALRALSVGAGAAPLPALSLGAAVHYQFGTRAEVLRLRDYRTAANGYHSSGEFDQDGINATLGALWRVGPRLDVGMAYETPLTASGMLAADLWRASQPDTILAASDEVKVHYPRSFRAGAVYRPRTDPRTIFTVDAVWTPWSDLEDSRVPGDDNPQDLQDTWDVRMGLEHLFRSGTAARFGFRRLDSYADREVGAMFFTAGVGFPAAGGTVSTAAELSKVTSVQGNWFPYPAGYSAPDLTRVEHTLFRLGVGFTRAF